jgi:hypothetical protein
MTLLMILIGIQTLTDQNYVDCKAPMRLYFSILSFIIASLTFFLMISTRANIRCRNFWTAFSMVIALIFFVWCLIGIPLMIVIQVASPSCVPTSYLYSCWILVLVFNYIFISLFGKLLKFWCKAWKNARKAAKLRKGVDTVYEKLYKDNFDLEAYLVEYKQVLNLFNLTDKEIAILNDAFSITNQVDQSTLPEDQRKQCVICISDFEVGEKIILHPGCKHTFHPDCIQVWFKKNLTCPICKCETRTNMLRNLKNKDNQKLSDRDKVLVGKKDDTTVDVGLSENGSLKEPLIVV